MSDPHTEVITRIDGGSADGQNRPAAQWSDIEEELRAGSGTTWLGVPRTGGVHTRPVFAAWTGSSFVLATNPGAAKTKWLRKAPGVSLAIALSAIHLVVEGTASRLTRSDDLARASTAMHDVYEWPTQAADGLLDAPYGAPTSGGPPFEAWEVVPVRAFAFPTRDQVEPTRFTSQAG